MRKLAWWSMAAGLLFVLIKASLTWMPDPFGWGAGSSAARRAWEAFSYIVPMGYMLFLGGMFLLGATVIADAITRAQGTREGP